MSDADDTFDEENEEEVADDQGEDADNLEEEEENEDEKVEEEEEEKLPEVALTEELVAESLSLLCKTGDGLAHAYVRLDVHDRELTNIEKLRSYIHLRYIDVSKNNLKDISCLSSLTHMLTLRADNNLLTSAKLDELPYLQQASFNNNRIATTEGINHPLLEHLCLNGNLVTSITGLDPSRLNRLHTLELRGNKLETTEGIYLPNLKNLFLGANTIKRLEGLERLENLTTLHIRDNQLEQLDGFSETMKMLQYANIRGNNVSVVKEVMKLKCLPMLRALVISENPVAEEDDYRLEVLIALRKLERLDKDEYTEEERNEAEDIYGQRLQDELNAENEEVILSENEDLG